jgi:hypothetical protein
VPNDFQLWKLLKGREVESGLSQEALPAENQRCATVVLPAACMAVAERWFRGPPNWVAENLRRLPLPCRIELCTPE